MTTVKTISAGSGNWQASGDITDAPDIEIPPNPWDRKEITKILRVSHISARWSGNINTGWEARGVSVRGNLLKKDGTVGLTTKELHWGQNRLDEAPDYVREWSAEVGASLPVMPTQVADLVQEALNDGVDS